MKFNWIKRFFNKPIKTSNSVDVATIDTSFIHAPKFSELPKKEQDRVLKYYHELDFNNYESLLKFSDGLSNKYSYYQEILQSTLNRYNKENINAVESRKYYKDRQLAIKIVLAILSTYEYEIIYKDMYRIKRELELRLVALDMFIKKESRRKYDFLGIFGKAERLCYLNNKNKLANEQERLKIAIKNNILTTTLIERTIKESDNLKEKYELLEKFNKAILDNNGEFSDLVREELFNYYCKIKREKFAQFDGLSNLCDIDCGKNVQKKMYVNNNDCNFYAVPNELMCHFYRHIAKYLHIYQIKYLKEKNEYKTVMNELREFLCEYIKLGTKDWNIWVLREKHAKYHSWFENYLGKYEDEISEEIKDIIENDIGLIGYFIELKYIHDFIRTDISEEHMEHTNELIRKLEEQYGINYLPKNIKKRELFINDNVNQLLDLIDIFNGHEEDIEVYYDEDTSLSSLFYNPMRFCSEKTYFEEIGAEVPKGFYENNGIHKISLEDIFYTLKFFNQDNYDLTKSVALTKESARGRLKNDFSKFISLIKHKIIEDKYDDRIIIMPSIISIRSPAALLDYLNNNKANASAMLLNFDNCMMTLLYWYDEVPSIKYLFVKEKDVLTLKTMIDSLPSPELYDELYKKRIKQSKTMYDKYFKDGNKESILENGTKIIIIPDDTKYSELSDLLDEQLKKDRDKILKRA